MITVPDEIKELLHQDHCQKNIRIHFPGGERSDICNDLIVKDSVSLTESLCSQNELKFGLCESPVFECEVVGVGNVAGARIEVFCEIFCPASVEGAVFRLDLQEYVYPIPYGTFTVLESKRQADIVHRKITAYGIDFEFLMSSPYERTRELKKQPNATTYSFDLVKILLSDIGDYYVSDTAVKTSVGNNGTMKGGKVGKHTNDFTNSSQTSVYYVYPVLYYFAPVIDDQDALYEMSEAELNESVDEILSYFTTTIKSALIDYFSISNQTAGQVAKEAVENLKVLFDEGFIETLYTTYIVNQVSYSSQIPTDAKIVYPQMGTTYCAINFLDRIAFNIRNLFTYEDNTLCSKYVGTATFKKVTDSALPSVSFKEKTILGDDGFYHLTGFFSKDVNEKIDALIELTGNFIKINRNKQIEFVNILRKFGLSPASTLYPGSTQYPQGVSGGKLLPKDYQSCWYDDDYTKPYGAILCQYKNTSNQDIIYTYYLTGYDDTSDVNKYKTYLLSSNEIIQASTWTKAQIDAICADIAANIEGVQYMPVDFVGRGLPYVEAGDTFEILTKSNDSITTIVLNRTISGEQVLTDSYKSV